MMSKLKNSNYFSSQTQHRSKKDYIASNTFDNILKQIKPQTQLRRNASNTTIDFFRIPFNSFI